MSLFQKYLNLRLRTVELCKHISPEDCNLQADDFVSPPKWHLAHTTWFFEEFILKPKKGYKVFNDNFSFLFNSYYNTIGERVPRNRRGMITRPFFDEILQYRAHVDEAIINLEDKLSNEDKTLLELGLNHEEQHQELLVTDMKYNFSFNPTYPKFTVDCKENITESHEKNWIKITKGIYKIGHQNDGFCFDNELGVHSVFVHDYEISNKLITNKEYLSFIENGGYENFNLWLDEGWAWVKDSNAEMPLYWKKIEGDYKYFTTNGLKNIEWDAPVCHINYYEASAFAEWKKMRLPTEFEWEIASGKLNFGLRWEWTNSAYLAYPNFNKEPGAVGEYNGKFMINQMVLRGSSIGTPENHSRSTYRNFFHPSGQWQFSGLRLVQK